MLSINANSLHSCLCLRLCLRLFILGYHCGHGFSPIALHLLVAVDQVVECIDICDVQEPFAVCFNDVDNKRLDVFAPDELEQFKTGRIKKVVARHGFADNVKNQSENVVAVR